MAWFRASVTDDGAMWHSHIEDDILSIDFSML